MGFNSFYIGGKSVKSMSIDGKLIFRKKEEEPYAIKIVAEEPNATVTIQKRYNSARTRNMQYSYDGKTWKNFSTSNPKKFTFTNIGDYAYVRARLEGIPSAMKFSSSGKYSVYGNIASLVKSQPTTSLKSNQTFNQIFEDSVGLVKAKLIIDFESAPRQAFYNTFGGATSLVEGPDEINVRRFDGDDDCFYMFRKCSSLITPPRLPSVNLGFRCYGLMFYGCTSLTKAPELPATTLAKSCYYSMFSGCTSLTKAPELPATTLAENCYSSMFVNSSIEEADIMATKFLPGTASYMFEKCTSLKSIKVRLTEWTNPTSSSSNTNGSYDWLLDASSTGTFYCPPELDISYRSTNTIPSGWTVVRI